MSQNSCEEISLQSIFNEISKYLKNELLYERLLNILHDEPNYKRLLKTGQKQFFDAPNESTIEAESMKSRLSYAEINYLALQVQNEMENMIKEKIQGEFRDNLKDAVLEVILQFSSGQVHSSAAKASVSPVKSKKNEQTTVLSQTEINNYLTLLPDFVQNGNGIKIEESNITNGQTELPHKPSLLTKLDKDNYDPDLSILFDDVSSVHTSDLSSFEDEVSLSSDDEFGEKKRLSLKQVQEKLENSQLTKVEREEDDEEVKNNQAEDTNCNSAFDDLSSVSDKSQRKRKPSLKYTEEDDTMPLKKKSVEKILKSSRSVSGDIPRKRGRPRKHST